MKTVFLDSSVLFSAVNSPSGGSAKIFTLKNFKLITSPVVLAEVERNVRSKLTDFHVDRFFVLIEHIMIGAQQPKKTLIERAKKVIVEKDAVILAEAKQSSAAYIVSLDIKHFFTKEVSVFVTPQKIVTPKMLLEEV